MKKIQGIHGSGLIKKAESGFTLFQAAIGLMVVGMIGTGIMHGVTVEMSSAGSKDTLGRLATIENSINQFYSEGSARYPCPAALNSLEGSANFGQEGDCTPANIGNVKLCTDANWKTTEGFCKTDATADAVIIGAVPFDALRLNYEDSIDFWKNKILYAVTYEQTAQATFNANGGTIRIMTIDDPNNSTEDGVPDEKTFTDPPDFILLSLGENGRGGFTKDAAALPACGATTDGYETENCNYDDLFFSDRDPDISYTGAKSLSVGPTYFDDITRYQIRVPLGLWFPSPDYPTHIISSADRIGIGISSPTQSLHVRGNIKAEGAVHARRYCDNTVSNCFDPESITGTRVEMTCTNNSHGDQALARLGENRFFCNSGSDYVAGLPIDGEGFILNPAIFKPGDCVATNQLVIGFNSSGNPICATP